MVSTFIQNQLHTREVKGKFSGINAKTRYEWRKEKERPKCDKGPIRWAKIGERKKTETNGLGEKPSRNGFNVNEKPDTNSLKENPGSEVIKLFTCSTQLSMKLQLLIKTNADFFLFFFFALKLSAVVFILLINVTNC